MADPDAEREEQRLRIAATYSEGSQRAVVKLENSKTFEGDSRAEFNKSIKSGEGAPYIAQRTCELCDDGFDADEAHELFAGASPEDRLKAFELLRARLHKFHKTYLLATFAELKGTPREDAFNQWFDESDATRDARDAKGKHYDVYAYFAIAHPEKVDGVTHAGLAVVDKTTRTGVMVSSQGGYPDNPGPAIALYRKFITREQIEDLWSRTRNTDLGFLQELFKLITPEQATSLYYDMTHQDNFLVYYNQNEDRAVHRYTLNLPQDEAQKVYDNAYAVIDRFKFKAGTHMCGDNAADVLECSWSYLFQNYANDAATIKRDMSSWDKSKAFFTNNLLISLDVPHYVGERYEYYMNETDKAGIITHLEISNPEGKP